jgi:hypothetical protein
MRMKSRPFIILLAVLHLAAYAQGPETHLIISAVEEYPGTYGTENIAYEVVHGTFTRELDPVDGHNAIITDIRLAVRNDRGMVEYTSDFFLIKPKNMALANGILRYDAPNRGNAFNSRPDSMLMARGYVFISAAWQGDVDPGRGRGMPGGMQRLYLSVPVAQNADGSEITGVIRVEFAPRAGSRPLELPLCGNVYNSGHIAYAPASFPSNEGYVLTKRKRVNDPKRLVPNRDWAFATTSPENPFLGTPDSTKVSLRDGFDSDHLYELVYTGKNPKVMGVGLAAVRDIVSFFRHEAQDDSGVQNPVAGGIRYAIGTGTSQSGNFMKTFIHLGFNEDLQGRKVFDAVFPVVGARQTNINMRFAVPGGGGGPRTDNTAYGQTSVRAFAPGYTDDITGRQGGIFTRASKTGTTPKVFMLLTSSEMYALQASPVFTDAYGQKDLEQPDDLRIYYLAGAQHSVGSYGSPRWNPESTVYPAGSMVDGNPVLRALWIALEDWIIRGVEPPDSRMPSISDQSLVFPEDLHYPVMKGLTWDVQEEMVPIPPFQYLGIINNLTRLDFGPDFDEYDESGVTSLLPPANLDEDYAIMVSQVDEDGNEIAGIRTPELQAPLGTSFGFNYDSRLYLEDLSGLTGSFIPFHVTRADRLSAGDERLSLEERYGSHERYVSEVTDAAEDLVEQRLLLPEDAEKAIDKAKNSVIF